jgi:hypothetical protein
MSEGLIDRLRREHDEGKEPHRLVCVLCDLADDELEAVKRELLALAEEWRKLEKGFNEAANNPENQARNSVICLIYGHQAGIYKLCADQLTAKVKELLGGE